MNQILDRIEITQTTPALYGDLVLQSPEFSEAVIKKIKRWINPRAANQFQQDRKIKQIWGNFSQVAEPPSPPLPYFWGFWPDLHFWQCQ